MDMLTKVKRKFILFLTLLMLVLGWGGAELFQLFFAEYYSPYYPLIPVFFYVFGFIFIDRAILFLPMEQSVPSQWNKVFHPYETNCFFG